MKFNQQIASGRSGAIMYAKIYRLYTTNVANMIECGEFRRRKEIDYLGGGGHDWGGAWAHEGHLLCDLLK